MSADTLAATHAAAFINRRAWSAEEFRKLLSSPAVILCGDAKSFILGRVIADEAEVLTLATDPQFRRQGLAETHLRKFLATTLQNGASSTFLEVSADNAAAKALYLKSKFSVVGERPNYYSTSDGKKVSAILMRREAF
ncbi:MAG: GNAT family N-acetyltransferase [Pseudomonadota bacterium]